MTDGDAGRESLLLLAINFVARLVGFFGLVYFARVLPPSELGVYFLFFLVVQVATLVTGLGLGPALVQRVSARDRPSELYSAAVVLILVVSSVVGALVFFLRGPIAAYVGADVPALLILAIASWLLADIHIRGLQGEDRVVTAGLVQLLQDVLRVGSGAVLVAAGFGAVGLVYGVILGFLATTLVGYALTDLSVSLPERRDFRSLFGISRYTMLIGPTSFVYFWFDTFLIGLLLTRADVSAYEVAWQTMRVLVIPANAIQQTVFPKMSRWASEGQRSEIERVLSGAIVFALVIPVPGVVGVVALGPDILSLVYRPSYAAAALPMAVLGLYMVVESLHRIADVALTGMDRADVPFRSRLIGVTLAVVLNLLMIPPFGLLGAAVATVSAKTVDALVLWYGLGSLVDVDLPLWSLGWQAASALVMGAAVVALATVVDVRSLPLLAAVVATGVAIYGALVLLNADVRNVLVQYVPGPF